MRFKRCGDTDGGDEVEDGRPVGEGDSDPERTVGPADGERSELEERVRLDLEGQGVVGEEARRVALAVVRHLVVAGPDGYADLLAGVRMAHAARAEVASDLARTQRELRQLERLMGGFATELRKLDEVLEVLAAYVRRMRGAAGDGTRHIVH